MWNACKTKGGYWWQMRRHIGCLALQGLVATLVACGGSSSDDALNAKISSASIDIRTSTATESSPTQLFVGQTLFEAKPSSIGVTALAKVSERRITRTIFEYVFKVTVMNSGGDATGIALALERVPAGVIVLDGGVRAGDLVGGTSATPEDTITIRHDRLSAFDPSAFVWSLTVDAGAVTAIQATVRTSSSISLDSLLEVNFGDQVDLAGTPVALRRTRSPDADGLLDQEAPLYQLIRRTDDMFEIEVQRPPAEPGLKVALSVLGYSSVDLDQLRLPIVMALWAGAADEDEGNQFYSLQTSTDPQTLKASAVIPAALFNSSPNGRFVARVRLVILQGADPPAAQTKRVQSHTSGVGEKTAIARQGVASPIDCPVDYIFDGLRTCIEVSMQGPRVALDKLNRPTPSLHRGIDLRSKDKVVVGPPRPLANALGVPGARVIAFRTKEDVDASTDPTTKNTGAMVRLMLGSTIFEYFHLGSISSDIVSACGGVFLQDPKTKLRHGFGCSYTVPSDGNRVLGIAGGTGIGAYPREHLHFQMRDRVLGGCFGLRCALVETIVDPFPYLLNRLSFSSLPPTRPERNSTFQFGIRGEDVHGQPVWSEIEADNTYPKGNQRFLCLNESGNKLAFEGSGYGLIKRAPLTNAKEAILEHVSVLKGQNTKCKLWGATAKGGSYFLAKATAGGTTTLSVHYTDQDVENTPLSSVPFAESSIAVKDGPEPASINITSVSCRRDPSNFRNTLWDVRGTASSTVAGAYIRSIPNVGLYSGAKVGRTCNGWTEQISTDNDDYVCSRRALDPTFTEWASSLIGYVNYDADHDYLNYQHSTLAALYSPSSSSPIKVVVSNDFTCPGTYLCNPSSAGVGFDTVTCK